MKKLRRSLLTAMAVSTLALSGCVVSLGNRHEPDNSPSTLGKELVDLKKALDSGAITEAEYQKQRERLLQENKQPTP